MTMDAQFVDILRPYLKYAGDQEITDTARLRDLGLDSMREIELLFAIEDTYGIFFPEERMVDRTFETGGTLWTAVQEIRGATRAAAS
jgi:acyl carrier protein